MTRGILIAGNETALFKALGAEAAKRVDKFAAAPLRNRLPGAGGDPLPEPSALVPPEKGILLPWSPGSPIAARSLIMGVENRLGRIDEAILLCDPPALNIPAAVLNPVDIEIMVNDHIKGWFFLIKELTAIFRARKGGILALAVPELGLRSRDPFPDLLGLAAVASFRTIVQGLLTVSLEESHQTLGFSCADPGDEAGFAGFVFKVIEETNRKNTGKWYKFGKMPLFNR
jgi:hypothetical protein